MSTAALLTQQRSDSIGRLERLAASLDPSRPLLEQKDTIHRFFSESAHALQRLAAKGERP